MSRTRVRSAGITCLVLATLLGPDVTGAQAAVQGFEPLVAGSRVRLRAPAVFAGRVEGEVLSVDDESIVIGAGHGRPLRVARADVVELEVSTGRRGQALKGMAVGAALGGLVFAVGPRDALCVDYAAGTCPGRAELVATGAVGGALWGLLIGHHTRTDRWSPALAGTRLSVAPEMSRDGWGVRMAIGW